MLLEYFQMVDRIAAIEPATRTVRAECQVPDASPVFEGHFPSHPILPGVLMIETMAQTGGWLIMATQRFSAMPFLTQVREGKMRSFVSPGQKLAVAATLIHDGSGYAVVEATLECEGKKVAESELRYRVTPFPTESLRDQMLANARRIGVPEAFFHAG